MNRQPRRPLKPGENPCRAIVLWKSKPLEADEVPPLPRNVQIALLALREKDGQGVERAHVLLCLELGLVRKNRDGRGRIMFELSKAGKEYPIHFIRQDRERIQRLFDMVRR